MFHVKHCGTTLIDSSRRDTREFRAPSSKLRISGAECYAV
ncbi:hypothetical protein HMPREF1861_02038 [Corynebacterium kroppenstedtii]|nr:hypothetical protein HMPREF1861_02038 [Corynebacterium kroppenstedtii]